MDLFLQVWAASFYLLNKALFSLSEGRAEALKRKMKIVGWSIYILGVPPWVIILIAEDNWIAASIEAGGVPAMLLGLYNTIQSSTALNHQQLNHQRRHQLFTRLVTLSTYGFVIFGVSCSFYQYGGITTLTQVLEIGVMIGFLLGGYFLARGNTVGWLFFMLMNVTMGSLMLLQGKYILAVQQGLSLCFVIYGYRVSRRYETPR